jgi:mono/diheme cytochrome c family protein
MLYGQKKGAECAAGWKRAMAFGGKILWLPVLVLGLGAAGAATGQGKSAPDGVNSASIQTFHDSVQPFLTKNCTACHNAKANTANLNLERFTAPDAVIDREVFEKVLQKLQAGEMPPRGRPRPSDADLKTVTTWLRGEFDRADAKATPNPGRVTARRLNRAEYDNTIRDLLGVDFHPAADFPQDDSGYGFDNIGDALSLSPVLMEKYLAAAEKAVNMAIFGQGIIKPTVVRHQPPYREGSDGGNNGRFADRLAWTMTNYDVTGLTLPSSVHAMHAFPAEGDYEFRISPEGNRPLPSEPFKVAVWIDGKQLTSVNFQATTISTGMEGRDQTVRAHVSAGEHWVAVSALRQYEGLPAKYNALNPTNQPEPPPRPAPTAPPNASPEQKAIFETQLKVLAERAARGPSITDVSFRVNFVEISGPFKPKTAPSPDSLKKIFICHQHTAACARNIVTNMAGRAWRRPATPQEIASLLVLLRDSSKRGASFQQSIAVSLEAMLVSPNFLFRIERDPQPGADGDAQHRVSQYEMASRLSYFLWSSMPDNTLFRAAANGGLNKPSVVKAQVQRMLKDPKASALVDNFGGQWLRFRALESVEPDPVIFMAFNDYLRISMQKETALFLQNLLASNGSALDLLNGKYSFLNEELARFYGIPGVEGPQFRKVSLAGTPRGGILTHGSVLTTTSYANRTSVVQRGKWVLESLLNATVPPPPPNVPRLDETKVGTAMSLRAQMEMHRANPICASCHTRMDPIGFGLENFDAIGRYRTQDGSFPIDASGTLPDGKHFNGPEELEGILMQKKDAFTQALTEKMLTYALGRGLEPYDRPAVKRIAEQMAKDKYRISSLVLGIVNSLPFQARKGDRAI